jgi:hypothetical protein
MELHKVAGTVNAPAIGNKQSNAEAARRHQKWKTAKNADDLGKMKEATFLEGRLGSAFKNGQLLGVSVQKWLVKVRTVASCGWLGATQAASIGGAASHRAELLSR